MGDAEDDGGGASGDEGLGANSRARVEIDEVSG